MVFVKDEARGYPSYSMIQEYAEETIDRMEDGLNIKDMPSILRN